MGMEGISWDEVNAQVTTLFSSLNALESDVNDYFKDFCEELSKYWGSGNAVYFGDHIKVQMEEYNIAIFKIKENLASILKNVSNVYSNIFMVNNQISIPEITKANPFIDNPFKDHVPNVGMYFSGVTSRASVDDCELKLKNSVKEKIETTRQELLGINSSLLDIGNSQKDAFNSKLEDVYNTMYKMLNVMIDSVESLIEVEKERLDSAKQQTVNTFNA